MTSILPMPRDRYEKEDITSRYDMEVIRIQSRIGCYITANPMGMFFEKFPSLKTSLDIEKCAYKHEYKGRKGRRSHRGYIANWTIVNGMLYLTGFEVRVAFSKLGLWRSNRAAFDKPTSCSNHVESEWSIEDSADFGELNDLPLNFPKIPSSDPPYSDQILPLELLLTEELQIESELGPPISLNQAAGMNSEEFSKAFLFEGIAATWYTGLLNVVSGIDDDCIDGSNNIDEISKPHCQFEYQEILSVHKGKIESKSVIDNRLKFLRYCKLAMKKKSHIADKANIVISYLHKAGGESCYSEVLDAWKIVQLALNTSGDMPLEDPTDDIFF